jgi:hypothetical protein
MTSTTGKSTNGAKSAEMTDASIKWDQAEKGYLTDAERIAKTMDVDGKGHLSREQSVSLGSQYQSLKEDNKHIKKQLYGLAILCVVLFIGTVAGTVMAVKNSKDTIVDMETGVMKVNDGTGVDIVTVKAQGTTFQTTGSVMMNEEITTDGQTFTKLMFGHCVSSEDIANMWLANEKGTDARLVILEEDNIDVSSIEPVTTGIASWNQDHIVMGGRTFTPSEECSNGTNRRTLLENNDMPSFDSISVHRALKKRVGFLSGRHLINEWTEQKGYVTPSGLVKDTLTDAVLLGTAGDFAILAKAGITNVPGTAITGDIGVSPIAATAMTGFALTADSSNTFATSAEVTGKIYASDYTAPTPAKMTTAISDMETAYTDAQGRSATSANYLNTLGGEIGGLQLAPGVYEFGTDVTIKKNMMFYGDADDVFIIKTSKSLTIDDNMKVILGGGAQAKNIFWTVPLAVEVGKDAVMIGNLLTKTAVKFKTGSSLVGRILSQTQVILDQNTITEPAQ